MNDASTDAVMRVSVHQIDADYSTEPARRVAIDAACAYAAAQDATVAVFPELASTGYAIGVALARNRDLDTMPEAVAPYQAMAEWHDLAICMGVPLRVGNRYVNAAVLLRPHEEPVVYTKRMLYGEGEHAAFDPGYDPAPIVTLDGVRCGMLVCFDVEFPELVRDLALRGAQCVLVPTGLPRSETSGFIAEAMIGVRALENQLFVAYANHCGTDNAFTFAGRSCIAAPDGRRIAAAGPTKAECLLADIVPGAYARTRQENPYLEGARSLSVDR